ncbi:type I secretion system permease/ATPase [Sphingopyxis panaciterrulae]|uniref:ATP-binding cassette subfamily C protein LapB n=1 Tax=Sphingopyxis panaciterrulae TaxID=462372 RepID=A0A7W9ET65_9SPHN|nr:type I secretion system permease/ATPase [Sphingopyxis panaciterrulae]MBB5707656.1 ATP-binding cassette subfamily C protein LapB [Sphingopyxis panaciterrulae]
MEDVISPAPVFRPEPWIEAFGLVARHYRLPGPAEDSKLASLWATGGDEPERVRVMARRAGLRVRFVPAEEAKISPERLPLIVQFANGDLAVVTAIDASGEASVAIMGEAGLENSIAVDSLLASAACCVVARPARSVRDARVDTYIRPFEEHWLRRIIFQDIRSYPHILIASLAANTLALAGVLFSMQVYDRVIPAESFPTLYVLFAGVLLAIGFDFLFRRLRMRIIDILGKRADMRMSDEVFGHALRVRNRDRPTSTGAFIAQLRDLEQVRELLTSTTVAAIADIPFFLLFLAIFWFIAGPLALIPLSALVLLVAPGLLAQRRLRAHANEAMRESSLRNAMLVEAVQGLEDIKVLQAEHRFQQQWNHYNAAAAEAQLRLRSLTNSLTVWTHNVQNGVYAATIFVGAPLVMAGDITTGVLVASSILGSRMIAPIAQVSQVLNRLQQARVGVKSLDQIRALPVDNPDEEHRIQLPSIAGRFALRSAVFRYADPNSSPALSVDDLHIKAGEKVAVLGRNGAGKSTLLQGCSGLLHPVSGEVLLDGLALHQIDPADVRRDVGLLSQGSRLFHGTIRENLTLGHPQASLQEIMQALGMVGADDFIQRSRSGLEQVILEGGIGLSGGQVQALLLARLLIREPRVVLLDEPTASMDEATERLFIERFKHWSRDRTVVIATHRMRVLDLVDRIIVIHNGAVALDQPKAAALRAMQARGKAA